MLEKHLWNAFLLYMLFEFQQLVNERSSFIEVFCQKMFLKILQNSQINIFTWVCFLIKLQAVYWRCFVKKVFLKKRTSVSEPAVHRSSAKLGPATLLKKTAAQVLSCKIWKLCKNSYFEEHLSMSAFKLYLKRDSNTRAFLWILWIIQEHLFCLYCRGSANAWLWNTRRGSLFNKTSSLIA